MKTRAWIHKNDEWKEISVYEIAKIDNTNYRRQQFIDSTDFYLNPYFDSTRLFFSGGRLKKWHFRFPTSFSKAKYYASSNESFTHKCCKKVIINELNNRLQLSLKDESTKEITNPLFTWNYAFEEFNLKIEDKTIVPDILIFLRSPAYLAYKWNRLLAIEIFVEGDTKKNGRKLEILDKYKIPTIQIKANPKWGKENENNMSKEKKEKLEKWIKNSFKKGDYGADLLINTRSIKHFESEIVKENDVLQDELKDYESKLEDESGNLKKAKEKIKRLNDSNVILREEKERIEKKIEDSYKKIANQHKVIYALKRKLEKEKKSWLKLFFTFLVSVLIILGLITYIFM